MSDEVFWPAGHFFGSGVVVSQKGIRIEEATSNSNNVQSTISTLQTELQSAEDKSDPNAELIEEEKVEIKIQATKNSNNVDCLDKKLRVATSCSFIANTGYNESGTFFLDINGIGIKEKFLMR